ncbi:MAG: hypothetical protein ACOYXY_13730 [Thermodesulfobacteriota bacterium]
MQMRTGWRPLIFMLTMAASLAVYLYLNTNGSFRFREIRGFLNYDMLAEAILEGQLHLKIPPHPGRIGAANPIDPALPYPFLIDAIIWDGKHYFLQEPVPGFVHALFVVLVGGPCPTGLMVIAFAAGCLIGLWSVLRIVQESFAPGEQWTVWLTWLCFALSGAQLYMVSRPVVYHESIVAGMFFIVWGTYFFVSWAHRERHFIWLGVAALMWGLGVACRITLVFYPAIFAACGLYLSVKQRQTPAALGSSAACLTIPVAATVFLLLFYNYYRFGDFLDFGRTHVIVPAKHFYVYMMLMDNAFRTAHVPYNLYHYFLALPGFSLQSPFLIHPHYDLAYREDVVMSREVVSSFLFTMPALLFVIPTKSVIQRFRDRPVVAAVVTACGVASLLTFLLLLCYYRAVSRYLYEFTPLLFPLILCNVAVWWKNTETSVGARRALMLAIAAVLVLNVLGGVFLGLNGMKQ